MEEDSKEYRNYDELFPLDHDFYGDPVEVGGTVGSETSQSSQNTSKGVISSETSPRSLATDSVPLAAKKLNGSDPDSATLRPSETGESPLHEVYEVKMLLSNISTLVNWCVEVGLLMNGHGCSKCGSEMRWKIQDKKIFWYCATGKHSSYRTSAKIPFSYEGMTVNKMVRALFMWYDQQPPRIIRRFLPMRIEDFGRFDYTICEICVWACEISSQKVGGKGVRVNLETGRRIGLRDQDQLVIGAIEADNYEKLFYTPLKELGTSLSEWIDFSSKWIEQGSLVSTSSDGISYMKELRWSHSDARTLQFNTGCLAEDLFRQMLSVAEYPFKEFARYVGGYFACARDRFLSRSS